MLPDLDPEDLAEVHLETLLEAPVTGASPTIAHELWFTADETLQVRGPTGATRAIAVGVADPLVAAVRHQELDLLLVGEVLYTWDGEQVRRSPLADRVGPLVDVRSDGAVLWLRAAEGLFALDGDDLSELRVGGRAVTGPFATGGVVDGEPVVWVTDDAGVHAVPRLGGDVRATRAMRPEDLAVDPFGMLWALDDGVLWRADAAGQWARFVLDAPVRHVRANDAAAWVGTDDGWWRLRGLMLGRATAEAIGAPVGLDDLGRLWLSDGSAVRRLATDRPVLLAGLAPGGTLTVPATLTVLPTAAADVTRVEVRLDGAPVGLDPAWAFEIDPTAIGAGLHALEVEVGWSDGRAFSATWEFVAGFDFEVTWSEHIAPIHEGHCARCHETGTETVLDGYDTWRLRYEDIVRQITSGAMPLSGEPLTGQQRALVLSWGAEGGFLP